MPRNGSGVYSLPSGTTAVSGTTIESAPYNAFLTDLVSDLNTDRPLQAGGTAASTAAGARANLIVRNLKGITTGGAADAYTLTSTDSLTPSNGDMIVFRASATNTGASTMNVDSTSAIDLKKWSSGSATALAAGDVVSGQTYIATYNSTETAWMMMFTTSTTSAINNVVEDTTPQLGGDLDVNGNSLVSTSDGDITIEPNGTGAINLNAADILVEEDIVHAGDTNNKIVFGTDTQDLQTGGSSRLDISDSGVRLGGANARVTTVLDEDAMGSDSATALATQQSIKAYVDANASGFTSLTPVSPNGEASFDFTVPTTAQVIRIALAGVGPNGANDDLYVRLGDAGGVETTGYTSRANLMVATTNTGESATSDTTQFHCISTTASDRFHGVIELVRVSSTAFTWSCSMNLVNSDTGEQHTTAGSKSLSAAITTVRVGIAGVFANAGSMNVVYS